MRTNLLLGASLAALMLAAFPASAQTKFPATLEGHVVLPAMTLVPAPADAPQELQISGRYAGPAGQRVDTPESVQAFSALSDKAAPRPTGLSLPLKGQPVQGLSGIKNLKDGSFLTLTDNGFGSKANSPDAMLMFHVLKPDWKSGAVERVSTTFLHDPDRKVPFRIVNENTPKRYLTGSDFDIESIQPIGDTLWFGDEFGPFLIKTDRNGKVLQVVETKVDGKPVRSPDHPAVVMPGAPGPVKFEVRRSKGFEGMAASPDGKFLYPLLEGPLVTEAGELEAKDGKRYLRILEFDTAKGEYTGKSYKYALDAPTNSIGDFNLIDANSGLIIERDDTEGDAAQACPAGAPKPDCFNVPAKFKRIYKVDLGQADADGFVKKMGYIDLMDIQDPNKVARQGGKDGKLTFPFFTIENVDIIDGDRIIVGNDNNLPFSSGRALGKSDDNELILLKVTDLLQAK
ncbi:esterase-like activity of phytase family protein [Reyranella sp.]|uniref:esterase-like activity of phytase family protein n=1 Tax=Reyranella sp. TaxID=1929291 RepID=UPI001227BCA6|nr:esterase-like activity of phytase family protein [Reyranella sp.]TAJ85924.1 MAG: glycerophosphodiester phosphodiesterase [Reyranella sp.]